jgi:rod shape-determining protein MreB
MARYVGLDLGTSYTRIWTLENGTVLRSPTAAAMDSQTHQLVALGAKARQMLGKTPENILTFRPIRDGVVTDLEVTARMLDAFFTNKKLRTTLRRPAVLLATPYRITEVEQVAAENAIMSAGARAVAQVPAIFAAAAGSNLHVTSPRGCMILSVGGGITEAAVISSGGIISARSAKMGGERFDMAIMNYLKKNRNLLIGGATAEFLKMQVGVADPSASPVLKEGVLEVCGRDSITGLAARKVVSSQEIYEALSLSMDAVARIALSALENVQPEISGDVHTFGIMLCGGSALLPGLPQAIARRTGLRVTLAANPQDCVIQGLGRIIQKPTLWGDELQDRIRSIL